MSDATSLPDLGFLIGPDGGRQDDYVPPEVPAFDVEDALGADYDGGWPDIAVPGGGSGEASAWEAAPASYLRQLVEVVSTPPSTTRSSGVAASP